MKKKYWLRLCCLFFLAIGIFARVWQFGIVPGDINQDEAFAGYEAYSILHYGIDSAGYAFPVYLTTWGSGMSALNSYLMIPFIAVFGLKIWVIRLPQVIVGCLTLWVVYLLMKRLFGEGTALCALFLLAISPWHIGMCRWGLDANLAPGFLIFGLYFFVRGLENSKYFMLMALMYGLSLYCYATIWPIVPLMLLLQFAYGLFIKKVRFDRYLFLAVAILMVFAAPLLLFLMVNKNIIDEIRLPFLSIPKLVFIRDNELSYWRISEKITRLWSIMKDQTDGLYLNSTEEYGIYYIGTLSFFVLGMFYCIKSSVEKLHRKKEAPEILMLIQVLMGIFLGMLINININRDNILFIPMILIAALGIYYLFSLIDLRYLILPAAFYLCMFLSFEHYYYTDYKLQIGFFFKKGLEDAMEEAVSYNGSVYLGDGITQAETLFFTRTPVQEYIDTVEYTNYPKPRSFGRYYFEFDCSSPDQSATYVLHQDEDLAPFERAGFTVHTYGIYRVAHYDGTS